LHRQELLAFSEKVFYKGVMTNLKELADRAIERAGGAYFLAKHFNISHQAVYGWDKIPATRVKAVAELTGIPPEQIRPDVF